MGKIKVVTLGAGTGQALLLSGLSRYPNLAITAVVGVSDNGGHSGLLRQQYSIPAVGDCRRCLTALAPPSDLRNLYESRDAEGKCYGNEQIAEYVLKLGSLSKALRQAAKELCVTHEVLPVTNEIVDIGARLSDENTIIGEWDIIEREPKLPIIDMFITPKVLATAEAITAIQEANYLVIGPGSLRTGLVSLLLTKGIKQAIASSGAYIIFVVNLMTHPGQTDLFSVQDHIDELVRYADRYLDFVIVNRGHIAADLLAHYAAIGSQPVIGRVQSRRVKVVEGDYVPQNNSFMRLERIGSFKKWTHILVHDPQKLSKDIYHIVNGRSS